MFRQSAPTTALRAWRLVRPSPGAVRPPLPRPARTRTCLRPTDPRLEQPLPTRPARRHRLSAAPRQRTTRARRRRHPQRNISSRTRRTGGTRPTATLLRLARMDRRTVRRRLRANRRRRNRRRSRHIGTATSFPRDTVGVACPTTAGGSRTLPGRAQSRLHKSRPRRAPADRRRTELREASLRLKRGQPLSPSHCGPEASSREGPNDPSNSLSSWCEGLRDCSA